MAPPEDTFPVSELEDRVHFVKKNYKEKNRKLGKDFSLKRDCELLELVQYSCTTEKELRDAALQNPSKPAPNECFPFVRLFRKCGSGADAFHVETTAWEGEYAWKPKKVLEQEVVPTEKEVSPTKASSWMWFKS